MGNSGRKIGIALAGMLLASGAVAKMLFGSGALAEGFSTSAMSPAGIAETGVITGSYPVGNTETTYYFAVDLKAGELISQISFLGRPDRDKKLAFDLLDESGREVGSHYIMDGLEANEEQARVLPVDAKGRYTVRLTLTGPETTSFRVELGGSALPRRQPAPVTSEAPYSVSFLAPTEMPKDGIITGTFPGGDRIQTFYYFFADLKAGDLLTQISFAGRADAPKWLQLELFDGTGRSSAWSYIMSDIDAKGEATRAFAVDSSGRHILRVAVKGAEGTKFKVEVGGEAFAATQ